MAAAKKAAKTTKAPTARASAATDSTARLEHIPITHHEGTMAISKAEAALELLHVAEEDYAGEELAWMRMICVDVLTTELERAKAAYAKAVDDKTVVA
jgi:hypothetical protein